VSWAVKALVLATRPMVAWVPQSYAVEDDR
jgi:hypothetical protein